jgi:hypothetical protein
MLASILSILMSLGTVASLKDSSGVVPVMLVAAYLQGASSPLLLSTIPFDGASNAAFPGAGILPSGQYLGRVAENDLAATQQRSSLGIDRPSRIALHLFDADHYLYTNYCRVYGFRGATIQCCLVMWQPGTSNFSSDAPIIFIGSADMELPMDGGNLLVVTANNSHNTATIQLPQFPLENRCPLIFPSTAAQRLSAANDPTSPYYPCGYSPDISGGVGNTSTANIFDPNGNQITDASGIFIQCDYTRSNANYAFMGCMPRLGNPATTSVAPDGDLMHDTSARRTGRFAGIEWSPSVYYQLGRPYGSPSGSANQIPNFSFLNSQILGTYAPLLYGSQWVIAPCANVVESGNDTKAEVIVCSGDIGIYGIQQVVVNGIWLGQGSVGGGTDPNLFFGFATDAAGNVSTGGRNGVAMYGGSRPIPGYSSTGHSALGDPFGSIARILVDVYKDIFTGYGTPQCQVLANGPNILRYQAISTAVGNGTEIVITLVGVNQYIAGNAPYTVNIFGNTWTTVNATWGLSNWTAGPPGTITLTSSAFTGSGTGGYVQYGGLAPGSPANKTSPWVLLDILTRANWGVGEIDLATFSAASDFCDYQIQYINSAGDFAYHARYACEFVLQDRRPASDVIAAVLKSFNAYLVYSQQGLLQLFINQTLADSQPAPVTGSNYNTPINSITSQYAGTWVSTNSYAGGQMVLYSGLYYNSLSAGNIGNTPTGGAPWWAVTPRPTGYAAYSFDETNVLSVHDGKNWTFKVDGEGNATATTPNQIVIQFQDADNSYVTDSLSQYDTQAITRSAGALQPGGNVIPESLNQLGISNFDQGMRVANVYMAELQRGNEAGDPRGTRMFNIQTTVRCETLRVGHLVIFSWTTLGLNKQLFRVREVQAPRNSVDPWTVKMQWHYDIWYTDTYGQNPQAFNNQSATAKPQRPPLPWQPNATTSVSDIIPASEWNFNVNEIDTTTASGSIDVQLTATGFLPVNQIATSVQPPIVPLQATTSPTGGTIPGGINLLIMLAAKDTSQNSSNHSRVITVNVPAGTNTNTVTISNIIWSAGSFYYQIFAGYDHMGITGQTSGTISGTSVTLTSFSVGPIFGPPDLSASLVIGQAKNLWHAGILGEAVVSTTSTTVTIGAPVGTFSTDITTNPHHLMLIGRKGATNLPIIDVTITGYTIGGSGEVILAVSRNPLTLFFPGDAVVITFGASINSLTTIGDAAAVNAYSVGFTSADIGRVVRITAGTGRYQMRTIGSATSDTLTVTSPWNLQPDATSVFIVEDANWFPNASSSQFGVSAYGGAGFSTITTDIGNVTGQTVLFQVLLGDSTGTYFSNANRSPFRLWYVYGVGAGPSNVTIAGSAVPY